MVLLVPMQRSRTNIAGSATMLVRMVSVVQAGNAIQAALKVPPLCALVRAWTRASTICIVAVVRSVAKKGGAVSMECVAAPMGCASVRAVAWI